MNQKSIIQSSRTWARAMSLCLLWMMTSAMANSPCWVEQPSDASSAMMVRILMGDCSEGERKSLAVSAEDVLAALRAGQGVELDGVMLKGDLMLDALVPEAIPNAEQLPVLVKERFYRERVTEVRMIKGPLIFRNVDVPGLVATNLVERGYLIIQGPVNLSKSSFRRSVDFSRTIFQESVDISQTTIASEGFFIKSIFLRGANFLKTRFGTHSRFHKALFVESVSFQEAEFHGLAEFLEVGFHQEADFSQTRFTQGTGFSGSQFREVPNFSKAIFEEGTFFRFAQFEQGAKFRGSEFHRVADFTDAVFGSDLDFSQVSFEEFPQFTDERLDSQFRQKFRSQNPKELVLVFVLAGLILVFFYFIFKRHATKGT